MKNHLRNRILIPSLFILAMLSSNWAWSADPIQPAWSPKSAAVYLDGRADWWLGWDGAARGQGTACVSCHTAMSFALSRPALDETPGRAAGGAIETRLIENLKKRVENWEQIVSESDSNKDRLDAFYSDKKPASLGTESVLNALILVNYDTRRSNGALSATTKHALEHLWEQQNENGAWLWLDFGMNPWEKDGAYYGATLAALAVGMAGHEYYDQAEVRKRVDALNKYLEAQSANQPLHHLAYRLWASSLLPGVLNEADKKTLIAELFNAQEAAGGWSLPKMGRTTSAAGDWKSHGVYPEGETSDGYATGLVVLALKHAGVARNDLKLQRGIDWLATNQRDGTWPANYVNKPRDPQNNAGKFMRDAATAFAVLALAER